MRSASTFAGSERPTCPSRAEIVTGEMLVLLTERGAGHAPGVRKRHIIWRSRRAQGPPCLGEGEGLAQKVPSAVARAQPLSVEGELVLAMLLRAEGSYSAARLHMQTAADAGNAEAMGELGHAFLNGG